jgi:hypothetical protein
MGDPIFEALDDILSDPVVDVLTPAEFERLLAEYGFMIVPIEDPTNLRFGDE